MELLLYYSVVKNEQKLRADIFLMGVLSQKSLKATGLHF